MEVYCICKVILLVIIPATRGASSPCDDTYCRSKRGRGGGGIREGGYFYVRHPVPLAGFHGGSDYGLLVYESM
jgi:hypothetical protein